MWNLSSRHCANGVTGFKSELAAICEMHKTYVRHQNKKVYSHNDVQSLSTNKGLCYTRNLGVPQTENKPNKKQINLIRAEVREAAKVLVSWKKNF